METKCNIWCGELVAIFFQPELILNQMRCHSAAEGHFKREEKPQMGSENKSWHMEFRMLIMPNS